MARRPSEKALEQPITKARMAAVVWNPELVSREGAIRQMDDEGVFITYDQLTDWELGESEVPADIMYYFSKIYKAPELLHNYCASCPIGKHIHQKVEVKSIETITLQTLKAFDSNTLEDALSKLLEIAEDGVIDETEWPIFRDICNVFQTITTKAKPLLLLKMQIEMTGRA